MLSVKNIYHSLSNTHLATLPPELLHHILHIVDFKIHCEKMYSVNKEFLSEYYSRKYHQGYYYEYDDMEDVGLLVELILNTF